MQGATPTALRETVREFAPSKSAKMGNFGFKEPWKILAFGKCRRKRLSYQCFQSFEFPDTLTQSRGRGTLSGRFRHFSGKNGVSGEGWHRQPGTR